MQNQTSAQPNPFNPLIVQSDRTLLLDVHAPLAEDCRNALIPFAELERSPEHLHTYRITPLSLWNAASAGFTGDDALNVLNSFSRFPVPQAVSFWIKDTCGKFGKLRLYQILPAEENNESAANTQDAASNKQNDDFADYLCLECASEAIFKELAAAKQLTDLLFVNKAFKNTFWVRLIDRGTVKQKLLQLGWPVKDEVPLKDGEKLEFELRTTCQSGKEFAVRDYQKNAAAALVGDKGPGTGFGTIVLPCGAGKTIVGMQIMSLLQTSTLIVTTNISAVHQWIAELLDKTSLLPEQIGEYTGEQKIIKPVTVATYQVLTWRAGQEDNYPHFKIFRERAWGLIIYDEVHLLPAPVFRITAELQTVRRVGLTATLVREDGCEGHVFSLVGPKRFDVPWKELECSGWIAEAECVELRINLPENKEIEYAVANQRQKHKIASDNADKLPIAKTICSIFPEDKILIIGQYIEQLEKIAKDLNVPLITGKTPNAERDRIYAAFKSGENRVIVVSKVANFAIDLPDASIAIQISGTFGSRQEEAQRLGRILRPKQRKARFFTLITANTVEEEFGSHRQKFLAEQGYDYRILKYTDDEQLKTDILEEN